MSEEILIERYPLMELEALRAHVKAISIAKARRADESYERKAPEDRSRSSHGGRPRRRATLTAAARVHRGPREDASSEERRKRARHYRDDRAQKKSSASEESDDRGQHAKAKSGGKSDKRWVYEARTRDMRRAPPESFHSEGADRSSSSRAGFAATSKEQPPAHYGPWPQSKSDESWAQRREMNRKKEEEAREIDEAIAKIQGENQPEPPDWEDEEEPAQKVRREDTGILSEEEMSEYGLRGSTLVTYNDSSSGGELSDVDPLLGRLKGSYVATFRAKNLITDDEDFASRFKSFEEAVKQAGREVAVAWMKARDGRNPHPGQVAASKREQQEFFKDSTARRERCRRANVRSFSKERKPRRKREINPKELANPNESVEDIAKKEFIQPVTGLMARMQTGAPEDEASRMAKAARICRRAQVETIRKALKTAEELEEWAKARDPPIAIREVDAAVLDQFMQQTSAKTAAGHNLAWLVHNLELDWGIENMKTLQRGNRGVFGIGSAQAPMASLAMVLKLAEELAKALVVGNERNDWTCLLAVYLQCIGAATIAQCRRSVLAWASDSWACFFCFTSIKHRDRSGYYWGAPTCIIGQADRVWHKDLIRLVNNKIAQKSSIDANGKPCETFGFIVNGTTMEKFKKSQISSRLKEAMAGGQNDPWRAWGQWSEDEMMTSQAWIRVMPFIAVNLGMSPEERMSLGDWQNATLANKYNEATIMQSYTGDKTALSMETKLKCFLGLVLCKSEGANEFNSISQADWKSIMARITGLYTQESLKDAAAKRIWVNPELAERSSKRQMQRVRDSVEGIPMPEMARGRVLLAASKDGVVMCPMYQIRKCNEKAVRIRRGATGEDSVDECKFGMHQCAAAFRSTRVCMMRHPGQECCQFSRHTKPEVEMVEDPRYTQEKAQWARKEELQKLESRAASLRRDHTAAGKASGKSKAPRGSPGGRATVGVQLRSVSRCTESSPTRSASPTLSRRRKDRSTARSTRSGGEISTGGRRGDARQDRSPLRHKAQEKDRSISRAPERSELSDSDPEDDDRLNAGDVEIGGEPSNRDPKIVKKMNDTWLHKSFKNGEIPTVSQTRRVVRNDPDPPCLVAKLREVGGELWTGPLPIRELDHEWFLDKSFVIQVGCFANQPEDNHREKAGEHGHKHNWGQGIILPECCYYKLEISHPTKCEEDFRKIRSYVLTSLVEGDNVYVHCITGKTRGPMGAAILRALATNTKLESSVKMVQRLRNCEVRRRYKERLLNQSDWMEEALSEKVFMCPQYDIFAAYGHVIHKKRIVHPCIVIEETFEGGRQEDNLYPLCQWVLGEEAEPMKKNGCITCQEIDVVAQELGTTICEECLEQMAPREFLDIKERIDC